MCWNLSVCVEFFGTCLNQILIFWNSFECVEIRFVCVESDRMFWNLIPMCWNQISMFWNLCWNLSPKTNLNSALFLLSKVKRFRSSSFPLTSNRRHLFFLKTHFSSKKVDPDKSRLVFAALVFSPTLNILRSFIISSVFACAAVTRPRIGQCWSTERNSKY